MANTGTEKAPLFNWNELDGELIMNCYTSNTNAFPFSIVVQGAVGKGNSTTGSTAVSTTIILSLKRVESKI